MIIDTLNQNNATQKPKDIKAKETMKTDIQLKVSNNKSIQS